MMKGYQKAQLLLKLLGDETQSVLRHLSESSTAKLTGLVGDVPDLRGDDKQAFFDDVFREVEKQRVAGFGLASAPPVVSAAAAPSVEKERPSTGASGGGFFSLDASPSSSSSASGTKECGPEDIAEQLASQPPQIAAFFLSKLDAGLASDVRGHMSSTLISQIDEIQVDAIPLSDKVFKRIYDQIMTRKVKAADPNFF